MSEMFLSQFIEFNPTVKLPKGTIGPFVPMDSVFPWHRDVAAAGSKPYTGGAKFLDGDVLLARITPSLENGKTSIYRATEAARNLPAFGSTEFIVARGIEGISDTEYIYYLLRTDQIRSVAIASMTGSSGRQRVQLDTLESTLWDLPDISQQRKIAATLGALDDKIKSNWNVMGLLNELLKTWFRQISSSGNTESIEVEKVLKRLRVMHRENQKSVLTRGKYEVWDQSVEGILGFTNFPSIICDSSNPVCIFGDHTCTWRLTVSPIGLGPNTIPVVATSDRVSTYWLYLAMQGKQIFQEYRRHWMEFKRHSIPVPSPEDDERLKSIATTIFTVVSNLRNQNTCLIRLRDTLLPELMSGRIRVPEAREAIDREVVR